MGVEKLRYRLLGMTFFMLAFVGALGAIQGLINHGDKMRLAAAIGTAVIFTPLSIVMFRKARRARLPQNVEEWDKEHKG